jgi:hypothetical protein
VVNIWFGKYSRKTAKYRGNFKKAKLVEQSALVPIQFKDDLAISVCIFVPRGFLQSCLSISPGTLIARDVGHLMGSWSQMLED